MGRIAATISFIHDFAAVDYYDDSGEWFGAERIELPRFRHSLAPGRGTRREQLRACLYENGYAAAERRASLHGAILDRFSRAS